MPAIRAARRQLWIKALFDQLLCSARRHDRLHDPRPRGRRRAGGARRARARAAARGLRGRAGGRRARGARPAGGAAPPDAVVLDVAMPHIDGLEVCRRLRDAGDRTPVLMLTARDAIDDRVAGLDAGADDYLVKPFALKELKARLRALLRRAGPAGDGPLRFGDLVLDPVAYEVRRGERRIELSRTEFHLLALFLEHPRQVLDALADLRARVGLRLRRELERARRLRRLPAAQDRGRRRAAAAAHGARRRLRPARRADAAAAADGGGDRAGGRRRRAAGRGDRVRRRARRAARPGRRAAERAGRLVQRVVERVDRDRAAAGRRPLGRRAASAASRRCPPARRLRGVRPVRPGAPRRDARHGRSCRSTSSARRRGRRGGRVPRRRRRSTATTCAC